MFFLKPNIEKLELKRDVEGLNKALFYQKDFKIRHDACVALGKIGDQRSVEPLVSALKDIHAGVRLQAIHALGNIADAQATNPLIEILENDDPELRVAAAEALGKISDLRAVSALVKKLANAHPAVRDAASAALASIGQPAVEPLLAGLEESRKYSERSVRWAYVEALYIDDPRALQTMIALLKDDDPIVRLKAVRAVGKYLRQQSVEHLLPLLQDKDRNVRKAAAETLQDFHEPRLVEAFIAALQDDNNDVQKLAAKALGRLGDSRAIEPLKALLDHWDSELEQTAAEALDMLGFSPGQDYISAQYWIARQDWDSVVSLGAVAIEPLIQAFDKGAVIGPAASKAISKLGAMAVEPLIAASQNRDDGFSFSARRYAADALGEIGDPRAIDHLTALLLDKDEYEKVRAAAATALGKVGKNNKKVVKILTNCLVDQAFEFKNAAVQALEAIGWQPGQDIAAARYWVEKCDWDKCVALGPVAVEPLIDALEDNPIFVRHGALNALEKLMQKGALDAKAKKRLLSVAKNQLKGSY